MYLFTVKTKHSTAVFKSRTTSPAHSQLLELPWALFLECPNILDEKDWAKSRRNIFNFLGVEWSVNWIDGRSAEARNHTLMFSWRILITKLQKEYEHENE